MTIMSNLRTIATHLTALGLGAAIAAPLAMAFGHTVEGMDAADWLNLPNAVIGALAGAALTYALTPRPVERGGRVEVLKQLRMLQDAAVEAQGLQPDILPESALLNTATLLATRLTKAGVRYQYARALTPPDEVAPEWAPLDQSVGEMLAALRDAEAQLPQALKEHGSQFLRAHLGAVRDRFGAPITGLTHRALA